MNVYWSLVQEETRGQVEAVESLSEPVPETGSRLEYLELCWTVILTDDGVSMASHLGLGLATVEDILFVIARAVGLAYLGRQVDLVQRSIRPEGRGPGARRSAAVGW